MILQIIGYFLTLPSGSYRLMAGWQTMVNAMPGFSPSGVFYARRQIQQRVANIHRLALLCRAGWRTNSAASSWNASPELETGYSACAGAMPLFAIANTAILFTTDKTQVKLTVTILQKSRVRPRTAIHYESIQMTEPDRAPGAQRARFSALVIAKATVTTAKSPPPCYEIF